MKIDVNEPVGPEAGESRHTNLQITAPANDYDTAVKIYEGFSK
ncbi:hypothetical protein GCM10010917_26490 [Paenibacillus physcomitrellae]|uniref:Uncharacterized protein n=1 Tax=Paenibacillus physcomitrellae TaxID=1619311 RepID=A0ABQ1GAH2_9BACL|nr:hypothetical protein GCM10010917_26490 [Paenibacillus physcomitrellae]